MSSGRSTKLHPGRIEWADVVVIGNGMVGHRFVEAYVERNPSSTRRLVVIGEERHRAYDRVHLSSLFDGVDPDELALGDADLYDRGDVDAILGDRVVELDTDGHMVTTEQGRRIGFGSCVIATGSSAFVPPIPGTEGGGVFVYRTIDDLHAIREWATNASNGVVIGGGLLGLEAANALRLLGLSTTVVEFAPHLMAVQLDAGAGRVLAGHIEQLGVSVQTAAAAQGLRSDGHGRVVAVETAAAGGPAGDGSPAPSSIAADSAGLSAIPADSAGLSAIPADSAGLSAIPADIVVIAAGVRPRDELGRRAGLAVGDRGGVVVNDHCQTSATDVYAIGEVACHRGRVYGLVGPGNAMAEVVADRLSGGAATFTGADTSTKLKLLGVDVASAGDPHAEGSEVVVADLGAGTWQRAVVDADGRVLGASLVGDTSAFPMLVQAVRGVTRPADILQLLRPMGAPAGNGVVDLPDEATVCSCHNVTCGSIRGAVVEGFENVAGVKSCTRAGSGCGSCVPALQELIDDQLVQLGRTVVKRLCPHFAMTRPELFELVRATGIRSFAALVERHGTGRGCEICKPAVASMFASLASGYILDGEQASLQDSNDHFLANIQRDGTYSVVPRVPGGEITPAQLIAIGQVAADFELYTKITGGQRIDLFGARVDQLPAIWARLRDAGLESGHAYGKAMRTVKSCVGSTWCRYGVQDSVRMAIDLELRYRGLRSPHKIKLAVSGCARECAEAQSKDVGVIATDKGWNLYVGGNGGMRPAHAELLAEDLDAATLVRSIDRYLMWYVRTADRLERTAAWQRKLPGGIDFVRRVVMDDELGIGTDLEADMARHVESYECEWSATLDDPDRLARFVTFVNAPDADPTVTRVEVRGQLIPAVVS